MESFRQRLLHVEDDLLSAMIEGPSSLKAFHRDWASLCSDIQHAIESSNIDDELLSIASTTAQRVEILADTSHCLYMENEVVGSDLMNEVATILSDMTVADASLSNLSTSSSFCGATFDSTVSARPCHIGIVISICMLC